MIQQSNECQLGLMSNDYRFKTSVNDFEVEIGHLKIICLKIIDLI